MTNIVDKINKRQTLSQWRFAWEGKWKESQNVWVKCSKETVWFYEKLPKEYLFYHVPLNEYMERLSVCIVAGGLYVSVNVMEQCRKITENI